MHTLAEVYAILTGLPLRQRITGRDGVAVIRQIGERMSLVALDAVEYVSVLETISETIVGGAAYDALIAHCAVKSGADVSLTWNVRDFLRFGPHIAGRVKTPADSI